MLCACIRTISTALSDGDCPSETQYHGSGLRLLQSVVRYTDAPQNPSDLAWAAKSSASDSDFEAKAHTP